MLIPRSTAFRGPNLFHLAFPTLYTASPRLRFNSVEILCDLRNLQHPIPTSSCTITHHSIYQIIILILDPNGMKLFMTFPITNALLIVTFCADPSTYHKILPLHPRCHQLRTCMQENWICHHSQRLAPAFCPGF